MTDQSERRVLEAKLHERLLELYDRVGQATGYWANYFLRDVKQHGGLAAARKLLDAPAVSEGFERLKREHLLHESVEAVALTPEFQSLFTKDELDRARRRLAEYGYSPAELDATKTVVSPRLRALLERVDAASDQFARWELRNDVVAFGREAIPSMRAWLASEHLPVFAVSVLEHIALSEPAATRVIDAYATAGGKEHLLAVAALDRIRGQGRRTAPTRASIESEIYRSSGIPEAATGGYCDAVVRGEHCRNPARHPLADGRVVCTTHRKAFERAELRR